MAQRGRPVTAPKSIRAVAPVRTAKYKADGTLDRRSSMSVNINQQDVKRLVKYELRQELKKISNGVSTPAEPPKDDAKKDPKKEARKRKKKWQTSMYAAGISAKVLVSGLMDYSLTNSSTDTIQQEKKTIQHSVGLATMSLAMVPGWGPALSTAMNLITYTFENKINNTIQRRGDASRLAYNFSNYNASRFGTYTYDEGNGEWVAEDAQKVQSKLLGKKKTT